MPVPSTVAEQVDMPVVSIEVGLQATATEVMVGAMIKIAKLAETDVLARLVAVITMDGSGGTASGAVKRPEVETVP